MPESHNKDLPSQYRPPLEVLPWWFRARLFFTRRGRMRLRLATAPMRPNDDGVWNGLVKDEAWIASRPSATAGVLAEARADLVSCLTWHFLQTSDLCEAGEWLEKLDEMEPGSLRQFQLRWELICRLADRNDDELYLRHARSLMVSPQVAEGQYSAAAQQCVDRVFSVMSGDSCRELVDMAPENLRQAAWLVAARKVCHLPDWFTSRREVQKYARHLSPDDLEFSPSMKVLAILVAARAREWKGDAAGMQRMVARAEKLNAACADLPYWRARARLQTSSDGAEPPGLLDELGASAHERRLGLAWALRGDRSPPTVRRVLKTVSADFRRMELPERDLFHRLLSDAIQVSLSDDPARLETAGAIAEEIEKIYGGPSPATLLARALKSLVVDRSYDRALELLEKPTLVVFELADEPRRIARILSGAIAGTSFERLAGEFKALSCRAATAIPVLTQLRELVDLVPMILAADPPSPARLESCRPPRNAPAWSSWIWFRCCLAVLPAPQFLAALDTDLVTGAAVARDLLIWARELSPVSAATNPVVRAAGKRANAEGTEPSEETVSVNGSLGPFADRILAEGEAWLREIAVARNRIAEDRLERASDVLERLRERLRASDPLTRAFIEPLCSYWYGATNVRLGRDSGRGALLDVYGTWMEPAARAQLALLALRDDDFERAEAELAHVSAECPPSRYARAVLCERRGDSAGARQQLEGLENHSLSSDRTYRAAGQRLLAALDARDGSRDDARSRLTSLQVTSPGDPVVGTRLLRCLVLDLLEAGPANAPEVRDQIREILSQASAFRKSVPWFPRVEWVARVLLAEAEGVESALPRIAEGASAASRRLAAHVLLAHRRAAEALGALDGDSDDAASKRARAILRAYEFLSDLGAVERIRTLADTGETSHDDAVELRKLLARLGHDLRACAGSNGDAECDAWIARLAAAEKLVNEVVDVDDLSASEAVAEQRALGVEAWSVLQRRMAAAIDAVEANDDSEFLSCFDVLIDHLDELPVDGVELWLLAARCWFAARDWEPLLESDLPGCVEDLTDSRVRLIIAMAYAQVCAEAMIQDRPRDARQRLRAAREALEPLLHDGGG